MSALDELFARIKNLPQPELAKLVKEAQEHPKWGQKRLWVPNPGGQTFALNSAADELFFGGEPGGGKAVYTEHCLPTPSGWTTMGEVQLGDQLFDEAGKPCRVIAKSPVMVEAAYRLTFSDGNQIIVDPRHQWITSTRADRAAMLRATDEWRAKRRAKRPSRAKADPKKPWVQETVTRLNSERTYEYKVTVPTVRTTQEIVTTITCGKENRLNHAIPLCDPLVLPEQDLTIDPYVLGVWLGDGNKHDGSIHDIDNDIIKEINSRGYETKQYKRNRTYIVYGLHERLSDLGLIGDKYIPKNYLRSSIDHRLSLLTGLMDTDGYCNKRGQCEIQLTRRELIDGVGELLCSLGIKAEMRDGIAKFKGREVGPKWRLKFLTDLPVFKMSRKLERQKRDNFRGTHALRYIVSAEQIDPVPMQCVQVDSPSHMYLCGRGMIPTHNSSLLVGTAICDHQNSIIFRKEYQQIKGLEQEAQKILGTRYGYNAQDHIWRLPNTDRVMEFGSVPNESDTLRFQGRAHDLKGFDEICHFSHSKFKYLTMWLRSSSPEQRCRVIATGNPPQSAEGLWVIEYWAPWLDPNHSDPAQPGELRWPILADSDSEAEIFFRSPEEAIEHAKTLKKPPIDDDGNIIPPRSRTFIPGWLEENPDLAKSGYKAVLAYTSKDLRKLASGSFDVEFADHPFQIIPTSWIVEAQQRWTERPPQGVPMTAVAADVAGGGPDNNVISRRNDWWFAVLIVIPGKDAPLPSDIASQVVRVRKDSAAIIIDCGGGYGGGVVDQLVTHNGIEAIKHIGCNLSRARSACRTYTFFNRRAEMWWRMREALDPEQAGGSPIALPPDTALKADLAAPRFENTPRGIKVETKNELKKRLGRSPDRGDAVVMCWGEGQAAILKAAKSGGRGLPQFAKRREGPLTRKGNRY